MKCEDMLEKMTAYVDGELPAEESHQIASHLTSCQSCQNALKEMLAIAKAMPLLTDVEPPKGLRAQIMKQVELEARKKQPKTVWQSLKGQWYPLRAAAAIFILCLTLVYNVYPLMLTPDQELAEHEGDQIGILSLDPVEDTADLERPQPEAAATDEVDRRTASDQVGSEEGSIGSWLQEEAGRPKRIVVTLLGGSLAGVFAYKSRRKTVSEDS